MTDAESNEAGKAYDDSPDIGWYEALRAANKPERIRLLLIGESPPDPRSAERRFFYSPLLKIDNLYRGVAEALYGKDVGFDIKDKPGILERMKSDGVWLIDAVRHPTRASTLFTMHPCPSRSATIAEHSSTARESLSKLRAGGDPT